MIEFDGCKEGIRDERNIKYGDMVGSISDIPYEYYINDNQFQSQLPEYPYGCVFFSQSHGNNELNFIEGNKVRSTGKELCDYALSIGKFDPDSGAWIIDGPKVGTTLGYLSGFSEISTLDEIKHSIANNRPVQCGSNQINWNSATKDNGFTVSAGKSYGHSILIDGYSDKQLRIKQSYGNSKWDKGYQYLNYSDVGLLFPTKFSLIDKKDPLIINYKQKIMDGINIEIAKKGYELGLWNGLDATKPASREEVVAMIIRAVQKSEDIKKL